MSELKTIGNKLFKTELGNQRVELGVVQDFIQNYKSAVDSFTNAESLMDRALETLKETKISYSKIENQAKELGIDLGNDVKKYGSNLDSFIKSASKR